MKRGERRSRKVAGSAGGTVYGIGPVTELLRARRRPVERLWMAIGRRDERLGEIERMARSAGVPIERVPNHELARRSGGGVHQGVVASAQGLPGLHLDALRPAGGVVVALDEVTDPHNLGAILRTAECAGARAVVAPRDRSAPLSGAALKVAEGAAEHVPFIQIVNLARGLGALKQAGYWVVGLDGGAPKDIYASPPLDRPVVVVLGAEGRGLRRLVAETCDELRSIPLRGRIESLNVSAAAAVALFELARQQPDNAASSAAAGPTAVPDSAAT